MMVACVMVGALILLAAGLVIYNILKVAVTKRMKEYGTLVCNRGGSRQLYALVTVQIMILSVLGLPLGMLLGALSAKGILVAATVFSPELFMADNTQQLNDMIGRSGTGGILPLTVSAAITVLFAVLAAYPSAAYASRVSPTVAMSGQAVKVVRRSRKAKKIRNFEAYYARLNLKRSRGRTVITILSIVMSITVYVALQSFSGLLDTSRDIQAMHTGDYSVTNETVGIAPEEIAELEENEAVSKLATTKLTVYEPDESGNRDINLDIDLQLWESFQVAALDKERLNGYNTQNQISKKIRRR